jgi:hypothetical protein
MKDQPNIQPPRKPRRTPAAVDLHHPDLNPQGRLDVLVARSLKLIMERNPDPVLNLMYRQFQPIIDNAIHHNLNSRRIKKTLRAIGLLPSPQRQFRTPRAGRAVKGGL